MNLKVQIDYEGKCGSAALATPSGDFVIMNTAAAWGNQRP
jgi:hypothetical protein